MLDHYPFLKEREDDSKFLNDKFADCRIVFCRNIKSHEFEAWYIPDNSSPYKICTADNVSHAARLIRNKIKYDQMRASDLLRNIDAHNEKVINDKDDEAKHEARSHLKGVVSGRQLFIPPKPGLQRRTA